MVWQLATSALRLRPLRTFLTALGIAVAVGSMVIFLSLGEGLRQVFVKQLGDIGPDLQVSYGDFDTTASFTSLPELPLSYLDTLQAEADTYGISRVIPLLFHLRGGFSAASSFVFQGLPPATNVADIYFGFHIVEGRGLSADDVNSNVAVIGEQMANRNKLELGDELRLGRDHIFKVVGVSASEGGFVDNGILVPLKALQAAIDIDDRVTFLAVDLDNPELAKETGARLKTAFPELGFQTAGDLLSVVERGIQVSDVVRLGISAIALIVGAIAVANTMMMSVFERTKEFGVVRAIGAKPNFLFRLVLLESILLGIVGAILGVIIGRLGMVIVNHIAVDLIGLKVAALTLRLLLFSVAVSFGIGLLSGLVPAARAARIPIAVAMARE